MSEWINQFENHQIHNDLRSAITPAEEIKSTSEELSPDATERIDRIAFVLSELKRRLESTDPLLIPLSALNNLLTPLSQITEQLSYFQSNGNEGYIQNAHNQIENVLAHSSQIRVPCTSDDLEAARDAVVGLRRSVGQHMRNIEEEALNSQTEVRTLKQSVKSLQETVEQSTEKASTLLQNIQKEFGSAEESRQEQFAEKETEFQTHTEEILDAKKEEWSEIISSKQTEYEELYESINEKIEALETKFDTATHTILAEMKDQQSKAEKVVGVITNEGVVGGYQKNANTEKRSALFWRIVALVSLIVLVIFAIALFRMTLKEGFVVTTAVMLTRGFVAVAVGILAGYAAKQADKHERAQRKHRKMELELASITPYLQEFPEEEARKIKTELAMKMFAQQETAGTKECKKTTESALNLVELSLESIKALIGK